MQTHKSLRHQLESLDELMRQQLDSYRAAKAPGLLETDLLKDTLKELYKVVDLLHRTPVVSESEVPAPPRPTGLPEMEVSPVIELPESFPSGEEFPVNTVPEKETIVSNPEPEQVSPQAAPAPLLNSVARQDLQETRKTVYSETLAKSGLAGENQTIGSRYAAEETLSDRITQSGVPRRLSDELQQKPLEDLRVSIGLNERFAIMNELFGGNQQAFYAAIDKLNTSGSYDSARTELDVLQTQNGWTSHHPRVIEFTELVRRRFGI